jgi:hypothetical protein
MSLEPTLGLPISKPTYEATQRQTSNTKTTSANQA